MWPNRLTVTNKKTVSVAVKDRWTPASRRTLVESSVLSSSSSFLQRGADCTSTTAALVSRRKHVTVWADFITTSTRPLRNRLGV